MVYGMNFTRFLRRFLAARSSDLDSSPMAEVHLPNHRNLHHVRSRMTYLHLQHMFSLVSVKPSQVLPYENNSSPKSKGPLLH